MSTVKKINTANMAIWSLCIFGVFIGNSILTKITTSLVCFLFILDIFLLPLKLNPDPLLKEEAKEMVLGLAGDDQEREEMRKDRGAFPVSYVTVFLSAAFAYQQLYFPFTIYLVNRAMDIYLWYREKNQE